MQTKPQRPSLRRRWLKAAAIAGAVSALGVPPAQAQALPPAGSTVRLVVGYAPGGPVDAGARLFAPHFSRELGLPVVVENRPGAGGATGGDSVVKAPPNGQLLFFAASPTMTISPHILKAMPFDPLKDLTPIAPILSYANVLVANLQQPFKTVPELIAHARANPGKVAYGSAGIGASNHLSGELLALRTGTQMSHVPYRGNAPAMTDVIGGQIQMMFDIIGSARNYVASGRVRPLAVTSRERNPSMPDVPTMREAGVPDLEVGGWYALFGPLKMPPEMVARYNEAARRALANEELRAKLIEQGYELWVGTPQQVTERTARELALWATVSKGIPRSD
ncbi:MAG: tripartite tricarboxylate transporter substrate binding protein [Betaproteobacteria bacterium]|nr:tripartite tricarboxylate transporter substrate binding protein [Betaproteobacteria bacterium]